MRLPKYILAKLQEGGFDVQGQGNPYAWQTNPIPVVANPNQVTNSTGDITNTVTGSTTYKYPELAGDLKNVQYPTKQYLPIGRQDVIDGFGYLNAGLRGISEAHARGQQQDYIQQNTANPLANLAFNDGRSRDVKYGYEQFAEGGELDWEMKKGGIHIKESNKGKFTEYKERTGKTTEEALHSKDPHVRKMANFAKNAKSWKKEDGGLIQFGSGGEKKVDKAPAGYNFLREENGRKYYNKLSSSQLPEAQAAGVKGGAAYEEFLRNKLASGVSPEELVAKKYIGSDAIGRYRGLYKPMEDVVYTEQAAQVPTPVPAAAKRGELIYDGNRHIAAELFYPSRDSKAITDGGNLNTQHSASRIKFRNDFGYTGEEADLQADEVQKFLGTTNTFQSPEVYNTLKTRAAGSAKMAKGGSAYRNKVLSYLYDDEDKEETPEAISQNTAPTEEEVAAKQPEANQDELVNSILQQGLSEEDLLRKFNPYKRARGVFDYENNTKSTGMSGFRNFNSYQEGRAALENQLNLYKTGKTKNPVTPDSSLYEAMSVYAPASDGNDPRHYAEFIAQKMGINPNQPIRGIDTKKWASAIEKMEGNKTGNNPGNIRK